MSNASEKTRARAAIASLSILGSKVTHYTGDNGEIETIGYIDQEQDFVGVDGQTVQTRNVVSLLVEDVGTPRSGDRVTDEDGATWTLLDKFPSVDPFVIDWTVELR